MIKKILMKIIRKILRVLIYILLILILLASHNIYYDIMKNYYGVLFKLNTLDRTREILNYTKRNKLIEINKKYGFDRFYVMPEETCLGFSLDYNKNRKFNHNTKYIAKEIIDAILDKQIKSSYKKVGISISVCKDDGENHKTCDEYTYELDTKINELIEKKSRYGTSN